MPLLKFPPADAFGTFYASKDYKVLRGIQNGLTDPARSTF